MLGWSVEEERVVVGERVKVEEEVRKLGKMIEGFLKDRGRFRWMVYGRRDRKKVSGEGRRV